MALTDSRMTLGHKTHSLGLKRSNHLDDYLMQRKLMEPFLRIPTNLTAWRSRNHRCFILKSDRSPRELVGQWSALGCKEHIISTDNAKEKASGRDAERARENPVFTRSWTTLSERKCTRYSAPNSWVQVVSQTVSTNGVQKSVILVKIIVWNYNARISLCET